MGLAIEWRAVLPGGLPAVRGAAGGVPGRHGAAAGAARLRAGPATVGAELELFLVDGQGRACR